MSESKSLAHFTTNNRIFIKFIVNVRTNYKLEDKNQIFIFSKHPKNPYLTRKIRIKTKWVYEFFSSFEKLVKHSSAIFSTIQNAIWTCFKEVRDFWKMSDFPFFHVFLQWFQTGVSPWIFVFGVFLSRFTMVKTAIFKKKCYFFHKIHIVLGAIICITFWSFLALLWLTNFHFLIFFFYIFW